jgi:ABC-type polysaccharide/polyol phosphate transport system ATPase subunit
MRLAFAMATAYPRDILIIDEIIGAGDARFFDKAKARLNEFTRNASILVVASHGEGVIKDFCNRAIYLDRGRIVVDGDPAIVWDLYMQSLGINVFALEAAAEASSVAEAATA